MMLPCLKLIYQILTRRLRIRIFAARKYIDRGVIIFRPGMNGYVRFSQQAYGSYPLGVKFVTAKLQ